MTEILKVGRACAIGSAVCVALALAIMPKFWLLGLVAGIAGGYIVGHFGYEFGKTAAAIPVAFSSLSAVGSGVQSKFEKVGLWLKLNQAHLVPGLVVGLVLAPFAIEAIRIKPYADFYSYDWAIFWVIPAFLCFFGILVLATLNLVGTEMQTKGEFEEKQYGLALLDGLIGLFWVGAFLAWYLWKFIAIGAWNLFKAVHSAQRVACGVDSVLGGVLTIWGFMQWGPAMPTFGEYMVAVFFGALIGAAIGIVMFQLLVKPKTATA